MTHIYTKALLRAAEMVGGAENLRSLLHAEPHMLERWMSEAEPTPQGVFLRAVDIISALPYDGRKFPELVEQSRRLRADEEMLRGNLEHTRERSRQILAAILAGRSDAPVRDGTTPWSFLRQTFEPSEGKAMVESALDAAIRGTGAPMGNIQIAFPEGLRIVAHRGFEQPFLDYFACVTDQASSCGAARTRASRVIVSDVASSSIFAGTQAAEILKAAGVRAVQSTPLLGPLGQVHGMLSTHFAVPRTPGADELAIIDRIAQRTAFWLDGGSA